MALPRLAATAVATTCLLVGCDSGGGTPAAGPSPSAASPAGTPTTTATPSPTARTEAQLREARLTAADMPGYKADLPDSPPVDGANWTSTDPRCAALVDQLRATRLAGSHASSQVVFAAEKPQRLSAESLDSFASVATARSWLDGFATAASACEGGTVKLLDLGDVALKVSGVRAPAAGDQQHAVLFTAPGGAAQLEALAVRTGDVVLGLQFVNEKDPAVTAFAKKAVDRTRRTLSIAAGR